MSQGELAAGAQSRSVPVGRVLVLGAGGMLGRAVVEAAAARGVDVVARSRGELDLCDTEGVARELESSGAAVVVNCAAFTDVDGCEERVEHAMEVNGRAVGRLARVAADRGARLVHVSTDYVFSGDAERPYREEDETAPASVYGESKLLGERLAKEVGNAVIVRTSWLFGPGGRNFVATILGAARSGQPLRVVDDQVGCPTYTPYLGEALAELARSLLAGDREEPPEILHYRNGEAVSWCGFARSALAVWGIDVAVTPVSTDEFPRPARRPAYSVLAVDRWERWMGEPARTWREALRDYHEHPEGVLA